MDWDDKIISRHWFLIVLGHPEIKLGFLLFFGQRLFWTFGEIRAVLLTFNILFYSLKNSIGNLSKVNNALQCSKIYFK